MDRPGSWPHTSHIWQNDSQLTSCSASGIFNHIASQHSLGVINSQACDIDRVTSVCIGLSFCNIRIAIRTHNADRVIVEANSFYFTQDHGTATVDRHRDGLVVGGRDEVRCRRLGVNHHRVATDVVLGVPSWCRKAIRCTHHRHIGVGRQHHSGIAHGIGTNRDGVRGLRIGEGIDRDSANGSVVVQAHRAIAERQRVHGMRDLDHNGGVIQAGQQEALCGTCIGI